VEHDTSAVAAAMAHAAEALLDALPAELAAQASFPFDAEGERTRWAYYPQEMAGDRFGGVPLHDLSMTERKAVWRLVEAGTSTMAYAKVAVISALDIILDRQEQHRNAPLRDPARYWVSIFGTPGPSGAWGWRFEGHHVSVHHTVVDGQVMASTPLFLGANPAVVRHGEYSVLRPMGEEEDVARTLLSLLDADQRQLAVLTEHPPIDFVVANVARVPDRAEPGNPPIAMAMFQEVFDRMDPAEKAKLAFSRAAPAGVGAAAMSAEQRAVLSDLVQLYVNRLPESLAAGERARIDAAGLDGVHFAWAGSASPRDPHYYRVHGPSLWIEYDCVQDAGNHTHTVWRDPDRDFAADLLAHHHRHHH
jgi:hypothetical protein